MDGIQPTYNLAERGYDMGFGGSGMWLFALLILFGLGGGAFGRGAYADGRCATVEDLNNSANFTRLESAVQGNGQAIAQGFTNIGNGICQLGYQLATDFGAMSKDLAECCCGINRNIDAVRYENAMRTAEINANTTAQTQRILDYLTAKENQDLREANIKSYIASQFCGVVRYPTAATFNAGAWGFNTPNPACCY